MNISPITGRAVGTDTTGRAGPTRQKMYDDWEFKDMRRRGLEGLFDTFAPLALQSTDAQALIHPFSGLAKKAVAESAAKGLSREEMFNRHKAVWTGRKWEQLTPDQVNLPQKHLRDSGISQRLSDVISNQVAPDLGKHLRLRYDPLQAPNLGGYDRPNSMIQVRRGMPDNKTRGTVQHEFQHLFDESQPSRSIGSTTREIGTDLQDILRSVKQDPQLSYTNLDHYLHNQGEIRARLNERLQRPDKMWHQNYFDNGLQSVFDSGNSMPNRTFHDDMIWGGE